MAPDRLPDPVLIALEFTRLLERLGIAYVASGSLASSVHGEPRSTNDVDIVADLRQEQVAPLLQALAADYYVSSDAVAEATASGGSFNAVHLASAVKVDVFVAGRDGFDGERIRQGLPISLSDGPAGNLMVDRPEYTLLRKLDWYRRGGGISDRQWRDVLGILRTQGGRLDQERLATWARRLDVEDLLAKARTEAGF